MGNFWYTPSHEDKDTITQTLITIHFYSWLLRRYDSPTFCLDVRHISCAYSKIKHECQKGRYQQTQNQLLYANETETRCATSAGLHSSAHVLCSCCCQQHCSQLQRSMQEEADLQKQQAFSVWHLWNLTVPKPASIQWQEQGDKRYLHLLFTLL